MLIRFWWLAEKHQDTHRVNGCPGVCNSDNQQRFDQAIAELEQYRELKLYQAARIIVENLYRLLTWQVSRPQLEGGGETLQRLLPDELTRFNHRLNAMEKESQQQLEALVPLPPPPIRNDGDTTTAGGADG